MDSAEITSVAAALLAFGRELESSGDAQVGSSFSGNPDADELVASDAMAFLIGVLFTQGIPAERAWVAPLRLRERLGSITPVSLIAHPGNVVAAVAAPPALHRFTTTVGMWVVSAARMVHEEYGGDASSIWAPGSHVLEVSERLRAFRGIGPKKAAMAIEILQRYFEVDLGGRECGTVAYDVQVRRVFLRTGLVAEDTRDAVEAAAAMVCVESPGTLDLPAWIVGRTWCRPREPLCDECRLGVACPRLTGRMVEGVGLRRPLSPRTGP